MSEIVYKDLDAALKKTDADSLAAVFLIHGEESLVKTARTRLLAQLLKDPSDPMTHEPIETDDVHGAIEKLNTFSFFAESTVVGLYDSKIFYTRKNSSDLLKKARQAMEDDDRESAAKYLMSLTGLLGGASDDLKTSERRQTLLSPSPDVLGDGAWLEELALFCMQKEYIPKAAQDAAADLQTAIQKGFAPSRHLIVTTDYVDKRRGLYAAIRDAGMVIDCAVPAGSRKADRDARESLLKDRTAEALRRLGKKLAPDAYRRLVDLTGFDLRTLTGNLEKLAAYAGDREAISLRDVEAVLSRTRKEPIYELTEAVAARRTESALRLLHALLADGLFPLQIMAALINQMRRLMVMRDFLDTDSGRTWKKNLSYDQFQKTVMPAILDYDHSLSSVIAEWGEKSSAESKKSKIGSDLLISGGSKNPYAVYQLVKKTETFSQDHLREAMKALNSADLALKTSGGKPSLILERVIHRICEAGSSAPERIPERND